MSAFIAKENLLELECRVIAYSQTVAPEPYAYQ